MKLTLCFVMLGWLLSPGALFAQNKSELTTQGAESNKAEETRHPTSAPSEFPRKPAEEPASPKRWPLMDSIKDTEAGQFLEANGVQVYGWVQQGFTANPDRPGDRVNFGSNFGWRANEYRLDQAYIVLENALDRAGDMNLGYRVDLLAGHDAPFFAANGLFSDFTGFDETSGVGLEGPRSYRRVDHVGMDLPQFYLDWRIPRFLTDNGMDIRVGKFYTLMGREVYPAVDTDFYSRAYENVYATPFTHTGALATIHATKTLDLIAGVVEGWDVFEDNNNAPSFHGGIIWNSADGRYNWTTAWITGPERPDNSRDLRSLISSYLTAKLGSNSAWIVSAGGHYAFEDDAQPVTSRTGRRVNPKDAEWYGCTANLFYVVDPKLRLGARAEWFRDDDGTRTGLLERPGFAADFYELTFGARYKLSESCEIRPEIRWDWSNATPFDDQSDSSQFTAAIDLIWRF